MATYLDDEYKNVFAMDEGDAGDELTEDEEEMGEEEEMDEEGDDMGADEEE